VKGLHSGLPADVHPNHVNDVRYEIKYEAQNNPERQSNPNADRRFADGAFHNAFSYRKADTHKCDKEPVLLRSVMPWRGAISCKLLTPTFSGLSHSADSNLIHLELCIYFVMVIGMLIVRVIEVSVEVAVTWSV